MPSKPKEQEPKKTRGRPMSKGHCPRPGCKLKGGALSEHTTVTIKNGERYEYTYPIWMHTWTENGKKRTKECYLGVNYKKPKR